MYIQQTQQKFEISTWLKRLGWLGFLLFLVKGLLWLTLPSLLLFLGAG